MEKYKTLIIDDDPLFSKEVELLLANLHDVVSVGTVEEARSIIRAQHFDVVLLDKNLPNDQLGISIIPEIKLVLPLAAIIVLTADRLDTSVLQALQLGAVDYLQKTTSLSSNLLSRIYVALQRIELERRLRKAEALNSEKVNFELIGKSQAITDLRNTIGTLANSSINILITGETGSGKEVVARSLNSQTRDKSRPFIWLNCGAISPHLVESELFGHKKGAFTGALTDKIGKIEAATGGDLFLDEIGDLPLDVQVKLLRVLQTGEYCRVGCNTVRYSKFRTISATNKDLAHLISLGHFREDLYFRISSYEINTVPLRERLEDIPLLAEHFVRTKEGPRYSIAEDAMEYLCRCNWVGNVRQLENKIECALVFTKKRCSYLITLTDLMNAKSQQKEFKITLKRSPRSTPHFQYTPEEYTAYLNEIDKDYLLGALNTYQWDIDATAMRLGVSRSKIYTRIAAYGLKNYNPSSRKVHVS